MADSRDDVYELTREALFALFGPGGSFRISLGRATAEDAVFVSTVADTIAWTVASRMPVAAGAAEEPQGHAAHVAAPEPLAPVGRRVDVADPEEAEYRRIWKHVEAELLRRRDAEDPMTSPARTHAHSAA
jgi:hypothetical protein